MNDDPVNQALDVVAEKLMSWVGPVWASVIVLVAAFSVIPLLIRYSRNLRGTVSRSVGGFSADEEYFYTGGADGT